MQTNVNRESTLDFDGLYAELFNREHRGASDNLRDRAKGALVGLVVGDCLGSPVEFADRDDHPWITQMEACPHWGLPKGYWTDDSSLAFCTMQAYLDNQKDFSVKHVADAFQKWFYDGFWSSDTNPFGIGKSCCEALRAYHLHGSLKNGDEDSQGNGSVMRFAPSWFIARNLAGKDGRLFARIECDISDITHDSEFVRGQIRMFSAILSRHIIFGERTSIKSGCSGYDRSSVGNSGWSKATIDAALWAFENTGNFRDALIAAVNLGGDADTIGAVCGQIAGSYYGFSAIPQEWVLDIKTWDNVETFVEKFLGATGF